MQIPATTVLGFIGVLSLGLGIFLILAGLNIIRLEKISVNPGKKTCVIGIIFTVLGTLLLIPEVKQPTKPSSEVKPTPTVAPKATVTPSPKGSPKPTPTLTPISVRTPQQTPTPILIPHVKPKVTQPPIVELRKTEGEFSQDEVKNMFLNKNFRHRHHNPNGNFPNNYEIQERNGSYVVIDYATGLMWQQTGSVTYMTWDEAQEYISNELNKTNYAGCSLWRLPTLEELASLLEPTEGKGGMFIDSVFESNSGYWTSDRVKGSEHMWYISFSHSLVYTTEKASKHCYVRAVCSFY